MFVKFVLKSFCVRKLVAGRDKILVLSEKCIKTDGNNPGKKEETKKTNMYRQYFHLLDLHNLLN